VFATVRFMTTLRDGRLVFSGKIVGNAKELFLTVLRYVTSTGQKKIFGVTDPTRPTALTCYSLERIHMEEQWR
jgi:hypothetical protein